MGNDVSKTKSGGGAIGGDSIGAGNLAATTVDPEYCWATAYWTVQHENDVGNGMPRTVYRSNPTANFAGETVVQRLSNRLKLYRHPNIVKYVDANTKGGTSYLHTEYSYPLLTDPSNRSSSYLVCQGLVDVIQALSFLHYNAKAAHNNISLSSIFYCPLDKRWKLGGLQWVERYPLINNKYLKNAKPHLEEKFIPPEDNTKFSNPLPEYHEARDVYGLGCVVLELLQSRQDELPGQKDFMNFAKIQMKAQDPASRPSLSAVAEHAFFQQTHVQILDFLHNVPLKSGREKVAFFSTLTQRLFKVPEEVVGELLVPALLSRMVLIDETARQCFLPNMLTPETENQGYRKSFNAEEEWNPILGSITFKTKVCDSLVKIFYVHDYTVRMVLLEHFPNYCSLICREDLEGIVLPNLLQGLKDSHEDLVSATLVALSALVPILGATRVVGQPRINLFSDGLPSRPSSVSEENPPEPTQTAPGGRRMPQRTPTMIRPSPIGAEEETRKTSTINNHVLSDGEDGGAGWGEWEEEEEVEVEGEVKAAEPTEVKVEEDVIELPRTPVRAAVPDEKVLSMAPFHLTEDNPLTSVLQSALQGMQLHVYQPGKNGGIVAAASKKPSPAQKKEKSVEKKDEEADLFAGLGMEPAIKKTVLFQDEIDEKAANDVGEEEEDRAGEERVTANGVEKEEEALSDTKVTTVGGESLTVLDTEERKEEPKFEKKTETKKESRLLAMEVKSDEEEAAFDEGGGWGDEDDEIDLDL